MNRASRAKATAALLGVALVLVVPMVAAASTTVRVSVNTSGADANGASMKPSISADGRYVAFHSAASDLVRGDDNGRPDVFVRDLQAGKTVRVSVDAAGGDANGASTYPAISADGRYVSFESTASDLVAGDGNGKSDIFVRDMAARITRMVSVDASGGNSNGPSYDAAISADGRYVSFESTASDLVAGDGNGKSDVFRRDMSVGVTMRVSVDLSGADANGSSFDAAMSADGRYVGFRSFARDLIRRDQNGWADVFVRDMAAGATRRVSVDVNGGDPNNESYDEVLSADGRYVAFASYASDLVQGDRSGLLDVFVRDILGGTTTRVSVDTNGQDPEDAAFSPSISADGRYVGFDSYSPDLVPGDSNGKSDVFRRDMTAELTVRVSVDTGGGDPNGHSWDAALSGDGAAVAFWSHASDLVVGDGNSLADVFVGTVG